MRVGLMGGPQGELLGPYMKSRELQVGQTQRVEVKVCLNLDSLKDRPGVPFPVDS